MKGIHVRDEVKALCPIKHISTQSRRAFHTVTWGLVLYVVEIPSAINNFEYGQSTNPKNAVKHRIASYENG
jgi:hypothetical protein